MELYKGHFLIATPQLADPNFSRSMVLLIEHSQEGAFGVIVNRPVSKTVQEVWREIGSSPCDSQRPIYLGGPVPGPLMALHDRPSLAELEPAPGVYFSANKHSLDALVLDDDANCKIFVGHSGWDASQLENEIHQGSWRVLPATAENVFSASDEIWETVSREMGRTLIMSMLHLKDKDLPPDPTVN
jgi:putative transcriptional regulator